MHVWATLRNPDARSLVPEIEAVESVAWTPWFFRALQMILAHELRMAKNLLPHQLHSGCGAPIPPAHRLGAAIPRPAASGHPGSRERLQESLKTFC